MLQCKLAYRKRSSSSDSGRTLHQARRNPGWRDLVSRCDAPKEFLLLPEQTVPGSLDPVFNSSFVKLTNLLFREILWRKDGPISDTELLGPERSDNPVAQVSPLVAKHGHAPPCSNRARSTLRQARLSAD